MKAALMIPKKNRTHNRQLNFTRAQLERLMDALGKRGNDLFGKLMAGNTEDEAEEEEEEEEKVENTPVRELSGEVTDDDDFEVMIELATQMSLAEMTGESEANTKTDPTPQPTADVDIQPPAADTPDGPFLDIAGLTEEEQIQLAMERSVQGQTNSDDNERPKPDEPRVAMAAAALPRRIPDTRRRNMHSLLACQRQRTLQHQGLLPSGRKFDVTDEDKEVKVVAGDLETELPDEDVQLAWALEESTKESEQTYVMGREIDCSETRVRRDMEPSNVRVGVHRNRPPSVPADRAVSPKTWRGMPVGGIHLHPGDEDRTICESNLRSGCGQQNLTCRQHHWSRPYHWQVKVGGATEGGGGASGGGGGAENDDDGNWLSIECDNEVEEEFCDLMFDGIAAEVGKIDHELYNFVMKNMQITK